jgi:tRNA A37 N6-isopentenylltransferase MiaA
MLSQGLVEETQRLRQTFGPDCAVLQTVGYLEACMFLDKKISEPQLFQKICSATRQLAKRQMTYWRNEPLKRGWSCVPQQTPQAINGKPAKGKLALKEFEVLSLSFSELLQKLQLRLRDELKRPEVWYLDAALL